MNSYNLQEDKTASSNKIAVFNTQQILIYDDFQILLDYYLGHDWRGHTHTQQPVAALFIIAHFCRFLIAELTSSYRPRDKTIDTI